LSYRNGINHLTLQANVPGYAKAQTFNKSTFKPGRDYVNTISVRRFESTTGRLSSSTPVTGEVLQIVHSGSALYALVAPAPKGEVDPTCSATEPCSIERLPVPKLKLEKWLPRSPFAEE
jgi:hypothetical protein